MYYTGLIDGVLWIGVHWAVLYALYEIPVRSLDTT